MVDNVPAFTPEQWHSLPESLREQLMLDPSARLTADQAAALHAAGFKVLVSTWWWGGGPMPDDVQWIYRLDHHARPLVAEIADGRP